MDGRRLFDSIRLTNLLSFGPDSPEVELEPLNVLIGPNASGKSNLIEAFGLLQAVPSDLLGPIRRGGGVGEWPWKGGTKDPVARIEAVVRIPETDSPLRYRLAFTSEGPHLQLVDEVIERATPTKDLDQSLFYRYHTGTGMAQLNTIDHRTEADGRRTHYMIRVKDLSPTQSILAQFRDPQAYPELTGLAGQFKQIRLYSDWGLGRHAEVRRPQAADLPGDFLEENASNLGLVLNNLQNQPAVKRVLLNRLQQVYEDLEDVTTRVVGGTVQILFHEKGLRTPLPATRVSDGTLRYLCLLVILCHPTPPPLVCLEEPELGLHMDILPKVAELLVEASQRSQLVVTTHSDVLVDALQEVPEAVIVCERDSGGTRLERLSPERLKAWLEKYTLGQLWEMGEIGGRRW